MSSLADRLRDVLGSGGSDGRTALSGSAAATDGRWRSRVADVLGGEWHTADGHRYLLVERTYGPGHRHGRVSIMDSLPPETGIWPWLRLLSTHPIPDTGRLLFIDLETTGLAGGAGTYAFLVGCGWFERAAFRIRQLFLPSFSAERRMLEDLAALAPGLAGIVTFNGKSFDLPLIETRFLFYRMDSPFAGVPHVDMLHPARQLWRTEDCFRSKAEAANSCQLTMLEKTQLGHVREDDVPGFEIPGRYFHYVRTSDARPLSCVLEHNRLDLLALAMLTARAAQLLEAGAAAARTAREAFGLGRLYQRAGRLDDARASFANAAHEPPEGSAHNPVLRAEALRAYAVLCRRERRYEEAAVAWQRVLDLRRCPPPLAHEAAEALAVHLEHRQRDLHAARSYALESLKFNVRGRRAEAGQYRLARLDRKLGSRAIDASRLV